MLGLGEAGMAGAEAHLRQPRSGADKHREGTRADLKIERSLVTGGDGIKASAAIGDDAGEDVEPAGRALGIGRGTDRSRQVEAFEQRDDVDAAPLQHGPIGEVDLVQLQLRDALGDGLARAWQEAGAHAIGDFAQPQIEARRLHLVEVEGPGGGDAAVDGQPLDLPRRQDAFGPGCGV